jgi:hypothetical protein
VEHSVRKDEDRAWKHILEVRFRQFLSFYFPSLARKIDWRTRPVFLEQELQHIVPRSQGKRHVVDALARVRLRNGREVWLLVHVEIQGRRTPEFAERTCVCRYRIFDRHRQRVVSLAVYTGKGRAPEGRYEERALGDRLSLRFPVATIESFRSRRKELERSRNPFAAVTLAHLALGAARRPEDHLRWKEELAGRLYQQGFSKRDIIELHRFLDRLVVLPLRLQREYERHVEELERRKTMPLLTFREERAIRRGRRKGREEGRVQGREEGLEQGLEQGLGQGIEQGLRQAIARGLELRFGEKGRTLAPRLERIEGADALRRVHDALFTARSLRAVLRLLPAD